jgi:hypothetical protein
MPLPTEAEEVAAEALAAVAELAVAGLVVAGPAEAGVAAAFMSEIQTPVDTRRLTRTGRAHE